MSQLEANDPTGTREPGAAKPSKAKASLLYLIPGVLTPLLPLLTLPIFTRILTPADFGLLALSQMFGTVVMALVNMGIPVAYQRNCIQFKDDSKASGALLTGCALYMLASLLVMCGIAFLFRNFASQLLFRQPGLTNLLLGGLLISGLRGVNQLYYGFLVNSEDAKSYMRISVVEATTSFVLSVFFVTQTDLGILGVLAGQAGAFLLSFCVLAVTVYRRISLNLNFAYFKEALHVGYPLTVRSIVGVINNQFDPYMIGLFAGAAQVGLYSIGQRFSNVVFVGMGAMENVFTPYVYKKMFDSEKNPSLPQEIGAYLTPFAFMSVLVAMLVGFFTEEVVALTATASYSGVGEIALVLSMYFALLFFGKVNSPQLVYAKRTWVSSFISILSLVLNLALNIPFIIWFGAIGAAWATFLSRLISGAVIFYHAQKSFRVDWQYRSLIFTFGFYFLGTILIFALGRLDVQGSVLLTFKILIVVAFISFGFMSRIFDLSSVKTIAARIRSHR